VSIIPINELPVRAPEAGRIRLGEKTEKGWPSSIDVFRFTSPHKTALDQLADMYGGQVVAWKEPKANAGQYELKTTAKSIEVMVKPDALSMQYELWTGGGCTRRCDGEFAEVPIKGPEPTLDSVPCICRAKGVKECKMKLRLNVFLPDVAFFGTWRLETSSENAAIELPGMFDAIVAFADGGRMIRSFLNLEQRTSMVDGKKKNYVVPTMSIGASPNQMLQGMSEVRPSLGGGDKKEIGTGSPEQDVTEEEEAHTEDVIDAQVVDDELENELELDIRTIAERHNQNPDMVVAKIWEMTAGDYAKLGSFIDKDNGTRVLGWAQNGNLKWTTSSE